MTQAHIEHAARMRWRAVTGKQRERKPREWQEVWRMALDPVRVCRVPPEAPHGAQGTTMYGDFKTLPLLQALLIERYGTAEQAEAERFAGMDLRRRA